MKKSFAAFALALSFIAVPSFAQYGDEDASTSSPSYEEAESEYVDESTPYEAPRQEAAKEEAAPAKEKGDLPLQFGVHLAIGINAFNGVADDPVAAQKYNEWFGVNFSIGAAFRYKIIGPLFAAPELNFTGRVVSRNLDYSSSHRGEVTTSVDENLSQYMLDLPIMLRVEPTKKAYIEAGVQLGLTLTSGYDKTATLNDYYYEESASTTLATDSWPVKTFVPGFVIGMGSILRLFGQTYIDAGVRFIQDLVDLEENGSASLWSVQLSTALIF